MGYRAVVVVVIIVVIIIMVLIFMLLHTRALCPLGVSGCCGGLCRGRWQECPKVAQECPIATHRAVGGPLLPSVLTPSLHSVLTPPSAPASPPSLPQNWGLWLMSPTAAISPLCLSPASPKAVAPRGDELVPNFSGFVCAWKNHKC